MKIKLEKNNLREGRRLLKNILPAKIKIKIIFCSIILLGWWELHSSPHSSHQEQGRQNENIPNKKCLIEPDINFTGAHTLVFHVIASPQAQTKSLRRRQKQSKRTALQCSQEFLFEKIKFHNPQLQSKFAGTFLRSKVPEIIESMMILQEEFDGEDNVRQKVQVHYPNLRQILGDF